MIDVRIANQQSKLRFSRRLVGRAVREVLGDAGIERAGISVAVVDDPAIARLHQQFLGQPGPTDVMSFVLEQSEGRLEGEVVASAETAAAVAGRYGWTPQAELLLYVIHGTLHLVGYDDATPPQRAAIRRRQRAVLSRLGFKQPGRRSGARAGRRQPAGSSSGGKRRP
jgi:probable rRNA maturation factor